MISNEEKANSRNDSITRYRIMAATVAAVIVGVVVKINAVKKMFRGQGVNQHAMGMSVLPTRPY